MIVSFPFKGKHLPAKKGRENLKKWLSFFFNVCEIDSSKTTPKMFIEQTDGPPPLLPDVDPGPKLGPHILLILPRANKSLLQRGKRR